MIEKFREPIVRWKYRIGYLSGFITTFAGILIITNTIQNKLDSMGIGIKFLVMLPAIIILTLLAGYLLDRLGFIDSEIDYSNTKNKVLQEIRKR
jgi:hypothetical protein